MDKKKRHCVKRKRGKVLVRMKTKKLSTTKAKKESTKERDLLGEVVCEPVETLVETVTRGGAGGLHVPLAGADVVEA